MFGIHVKSGEGTFVLNDGNAFYDEQSTYSNINCYEGCYYAGNVGSLSEFKDITVSNCNSSTNAAVISAIGLTT